LAQEYVIKYPDARPSFKQRKCLFAIVMAKTNDKAKAKVVSAKPKTRAEASALIQSLQS